MATKTSKKVPKPLTPAKYPKPRDGYVFILRNCRRDMTAFGGFTWPTKGKITAPDFSSIPKCGRGLHGFYKGHGDFSLAHADQYGQAKWLVVEVKDSSVISLGSRKVKFKTGRVVYCGDRDTASAIVKNTYPTMPVMCSNAVAGFKGRAVAGTRGRALAGIRGTALVGNKGVAIAGAGGEVMGGPGAVLIIASQYGTLAVAKVGHDGIRPGVIYKLEQATNKFVPGRADK